MTKLGALRCLGECALGGGCITGGVECAKIKSSMQKNLNAMESGKNDADRKYNEETTKVAKLEKEVACAKTALTYAKLHFHNIGGSGQQAHELTQHGRDAKQGLRLELEKCELKGWSNTLN